MHGSSNKKHCPARPGRGAHDCHRRLNTLVRFFFVAAAAVATSSALAGPVGVPPPASLLDCEVRPLLLGVIAAAAAAAAASEVRGVLAGVPPADGTGDMALPPCTGACMQLHGRVHVCVVRGVAVCLWL